MTRRILAAVAMMTLATQASFGGGTDTRTGWIACEACSKGRAENAAADAAHPRAPNRDCTQKCIREGSAVMFYDEATRTLYRVDNPSSTTGQESHRVEVTGTVDAKAGTIHIASVKVLEEYVAKCAVPPAK